MKNLLVGTFLAVGLMGSAPALSSEVTGASRTYTHSCGYFSNRSADVVIEYENTTLEWGVIVELIYGLDGYDVRGGGPHVVYSRVEWQQENRMTLAASAGYTWKADLTVPVTYRSSSRIYDGVDFVFRIIHPDGRIEFDNGTDSPWGFYRLMLAPNGGCVSSDQPRPGFQPSEVTTVSRW